MSLTRLRQSGRRSSDISIFGSYPTETIRNERRINYRYGFARDNALLTTDMLLHVAPILARRLDGANQALVELMIQVDYPRKMIEKTAKKMKGLLGASGVHLSYAGYNLFN